jgi:enhancing lycopene biosynthesis protein 2
MNETSPEQTADTKYIVNPDVSCREEGPDGALLFNPDTDQVLVINITGLVIWEALEAPATRAAVVEAVKTRCADVPDEVAADVDEFIDQMLAKGFVGTVEN